MFMAALFITAQKWKHLTHASSCKWATKVWYPYHEIPLSNKEEIHMLQQG